MTSRGVRRLIRNKKEAVKLARRQEYQRAAKIDNAVRMAREAEARNYDPTPQLRKKPPA